VERTFFTRRPGPRERRLFEAMVEVRHAVIDGVREGASPAELDLRARRILERGGAGEVLHRTGHGIGLTLHEEPYIARGYRGVLADGMVFSV
jgi:Xaa-Pro aminopeptidase